MAHDMVMVLSVSHMMDSEPGCLAFVLDDGALAH